MAEESSMKSGISSGYRGRTPLPGYEVNEYPEGEDITMETPSAEFVPFEETLQGSPVSPQRESFMEMGGATGMPRIAANPVDINAARGFANNMVTNGNYQHPEYREKLMAMFPKVPGYADGGIARRKNCKNGAMVKGPGTATSDSIPAMLSDGEAVIPAAVVAKHGEGFFQKFIDEAPAKAKTFVKSGEVHAAGGFFADSDALNPNSMRSPQYQLDAQRDSAKQVQNAQADDSANVDSALAGIHANISAKAGIARRKALNSGINQFGQRDTRYDRVPLPPNEYKPDVASGGGAPSADSNILSTLVGKKGAAIPGILKDDLVTGAQAAGATVADTAKSAGAGAVKEVKENYDPEEYGAAGVFPRIVSHAYNAITDRLVDKQDTAGIKPAVTSGGVAPVTNKTAPVAPVTNKTAPVAPVTNKTAPVAPVDAAVSAGVETSPVTGYARNDRVAGSSGTDTSAGTSASPEPQVFNNTTVQHNAKTVNAITKDGIGTQSVTTPSWTENRIDLGTGNYIGDRNARSAESQGIMRGFAGTKSTPEQLALRADSVAKADQRIAEGKAWDAQNAPQPVQQAMPFQTYEEPQEDPRVSQAYAVLGQQASGHDLFGDKALAKNKIAAAQLIQSGNESNRARMEGLLAQQREQLGYQQHRDTLAAAQVQNGINNRFTGRKLEQDAQQLDATARNNTLKEAELANDRKENRRLQQAKIDQDQAIADSTPREFTLNDGETTVHTTKAELPRIQEMADKSARGDAFMKANKQGWLESDEAYAARKEAAMNGDKTKAAPVFDNSKTAVTARYNAKLNSLKDPAEKAKLTALYTKAIAEAGN